MLSMIARCERCQEISEVKRFTVFDQEFQLCSSCEPKKEKFVVTMLRSARYGERGGFIYAAPWWACNKRTAEDEAWEEETFGLCWREL